MIRQIDKKDNVVIQKVWNLKGKIIGYQTLKLEDVGNSDRVIMSSTLRDARGVMERLTKEERA